VKSEEWTGYLRVAVAGVEIHIGAEVMHCPPPKRGVS
jgi:hypothetical protein